MPDDPIVDEIRRNREDYASRFDFDIDAMVDDVQRRQTSDGRPVVRRPPRPVDKTWIAEEVRAARGR